MTRFLTVVVMTLVLAAAASAEAQNCYSGQNYYSAYQATSYQPVVSPSQSRTWYQPGISHYQPVVSTYFQSMPAPQPAASTVCQPVISSYPPFGLLNPTPLLVTSDCDGCDRIKEIEEKIAKLRAKLDNGTSSSSVQQQLDLHEKDIARQAELLEKISIRLEELTGVVKDLADVTIGEENKDDKKADAGTDE